MLRRTTLLATLAALATACGPGSEPEAPSPRTLTQAEIEEARAQLKLAAEAAAKARAALELLGVLPVYTCGEPRRTFVGQATESFRTQVACVTVATEAQGATADAAILSFPDSGCAVRGHGLAGQARFVYSGGESRMDLTADLRALKVDGAPLGALVGYGTCGDESRYWAQATGELPGRAGHTFQVDGRVGKRNGIPLFGGTSLLLDGTGKLQVPEGTHHLTLTGVLYEVGEYAPREGEVLVVTAAGRRVKATFKPGLWQVGKMELVVDDAEPVTVPILH
jgi:hypothetical protein